MYVFLVILERKISLKSPGTLNMLFMFAQCECTLRAYVHPAEVGAKDQRINGKYQRKFSLSLSFGLSIA